MHGCSGGVRGCSGGACVVAPRGACMVAPGGHAWLLQGGVCGEGGMCGMHPLTPEIRPVIAREVCILLECILVFGMQVHLYHI